MYKIDLYFKDKLYHITINIIKREEGFVIYWCMVYGSRQERFNCVRIDDKPLIITSSSIKNKDFELAVLNSIEEFDRENANKEFDSMVQYC